MTEPSNSLVRRRIDGTYTVDEWGYDEDLVAMVSPLLALRWGIDVQGAEIVPDDGPVLLVANRHIGFSEPFVLARGLRLSTTRVVRMTGTPDIAPVGPILRRMGGVLERPDEIAGLLRAGQVVGVALSRTPIRRHLAGWMRPELVAPALATHAAVLPVAVVGRELGRRWTIRIGSPLEPPTSRGPLAAAELADRARAAVQTLLDDVLPPTRLRR